MRPDLAKCTTESYRRGRGYAHLYKMKFGGKVAVDPDPEDDYLNEYGGFHSSARHRHWESKDFTDRLGALKGNLRKNLGRRWDEVFSEFCRLLDRRSLSGYHIWTHLQQEVEMKTFMSGGKVYAVSRYGGTEYEASGFYVHPVTGILEYKESRWVHIRRRRREKAKHKIPDFFLMPGKEEWTYRQFDGRWYRCKLVGTEWVVMVVRERSRYRPEETGVVEVPKYLKRSCNKKELAWIRAEIAKLQA
jgi:hypothetical protein